MAQGVCELLWLQMVLKELWVKVEGLIKLPYDNRATINIAHNLIQHDKTKHVKIDKHFIKEKLENGLICMPFIPSSLQFPYILTKGLHD